MVIDLTGKHLKLVGNTGRVETQALGENRLLEIDKLVNPRQDANRLAGTHTAKMLRRMKTHTTFTV